jgi:MSHA pilin protein MshC
MKLRVGSWEFACLPDRQGVQGIKIKFSELQMNVNALNSLSLRGGRCDRRSNPKQNEIATPFGLAMTCKNHRCLSINQFEHRNLNFKGVTLIEVILMMIIVGILAVVLMPRINFTLSSSASVDGAANMVASDIRYAQEFAMANRVSKSVTFTSGSSSYTFNPANSLDPSGQLPEGVTISSDFSVTFNSLGEPIVGGAGWVEVTGGGQTKKITVENYTGKASIP